MRDRVMQITIRGHHLTVTPAIEEDIRLKFAEMTKHLDQVNSMQVKLMKDHQVDQRSRKGRLFVCQGLNCLLKQPLMICTLQLKK